MVVLKTTMSIWHSACSARLAFRAEQRVWTCVSSVLLLLCKKHEDRTAAYGSKDRKTGQLGGNA
eukprot:96514-Pelagomonas_calceolata.AAC.1